MNKQQLASQIYSKCDSLRGTVDASVYKDYILGFIFYKRLCVKEVEYLKNELFYEETDFKDELVESNTDLKNDILQSIGYFIPDEYLFSNWAKSGRVEVDQVSRALISFDRTINHEYDTLYKGIFTELQDGLKKLGTSVNEQNKQVRELVKLANKIPMDGEYDTLGYIYEYLISNFAADAGKKSGEFYTPNEPSRIMAAIVSKFVKGRDSIKVFDPTSGSSALLTTIGKAFVKEGGDFDRVHYYAQEKNETTYNLTRMNLIMKDIKPANITTRNGDTLTKDWPYVTNNDGSVDPLIVDAVVSNPPYSQKWTPKMDPRFTYGLAPKSKADYAFLLHDLHHIDSNGIVTVVLPHGVLFRGNPNDESEGSIRKNLVEHKNIDAIIGLPANLFYGTGIPTIIMVLKNEQGRTEDDILFIDASKLFVKDGKKNKLRDCDIKQITDAYFERRNQPKFCRVVSKEEIRQNDYNLNITRYVNSNEEGERWDPYGIMNGVIPNNEIDEYKEFWETFPNLKESLFTKVNDCYSKVKEGFEDIIKSNLDIENYINNFNEQFKDLESYLNDKLVKNIDNVDLASEEDSIVNYIFEKLQNVALVNKYDIYQIFATKWKEIFNDINMLRKDRDSLNAEEPIYKIVDDDEVQIGTDGKYIPFDLIKKTILKEDYNTIESLKAKVEEIDGELESLIGELPQEVAEVITDGESFDNNTIKEVVADAYKEIEDGEIGILNKYLELLSTKPSKKDKLAFIKNNNVSWNNIDSSKDGTYSKKNVESYLKTLYASCEFDPESPEYFGKKVSLLNESKKSLNKEIKEQTKLLDNKAIETLKNLPKEECLELIHAKWIKPLVQDIMSFTGKVLDNINDKVLYLDDKYKVSAVELEEDSIKVNKKLSSLIDELTGSEYDIKGLFDFKKMLGADND